MRLVLFSIFLLGTSLLCRDSFAAEVLRVGSSQRVVAVSHDTRRWAMGDRACFYQNNEEIVCGRVALSTASHAVVKLEEPNALIARGDKARLISLQTETRRVESSRKPAALIESNEKLETPPTYLHNFSGGVTVGSGFYFPLLHFQRMVTEHIAIGLMPLYSRVSADTGSISALGGYATINYYGNEFFHGLWFQGGAGVYLLSHESATKDEQATCPAFIATAGWRGYWDLGFNVGLAGGFQYLRDPNFTSVKLSGSNLSPMLLVDIGFNF